jgi:D-galactarolactone cycloisomerase
MKITNVRVFELSAVLPEDKGWRSDHGTRLKFDTAMVKVDTDEGISGYGPTYGTAPVVKAAVEQRLKQLLLGEDPTRIEYLWEKMYSGSRLSIALREGRSVPTPASGARGENMIAISGIDVALWDIAGRALGVPIYKLLGGMVRDKIRGYASGGWATGEAAGEEIAGYVAKGFNAIKMRIGGMDKSLNESITRVAAVRKAVGPDIQIMLDAHGSMGVAHAIKLAKAMEQFNCTWLEEPVTPDDKKGMAEVRAASSTPIASGECEFTRYSFRDLIDARAVDWLQPDIAVCGGMTEIRKICALASAHNLPVAPHVWGSACIFAATLQLAAATPNIPIFETSQAPLHPLLWDMTEPKFKVENGYVHVPQGPGLGVELDPDMEKRFPYADIPALIPF